MNTDYLRYFATLAELQHYGNAAKELNISQPGLSHAIRSLEKDYGLPLFEKTGRNVRLSPYGLELKKTYRCHFKQLGQIRTDHL